MGCAFWNWVGDHFFTGGMIASDDLMLYLQDHLTVEAHWRVIGSHYHKTAEAWLVNLEARREKILNILKKTYGAEKAKRWLHSAGAYFLWPAPNCGVFETCRNEWCLITF